MADDTNILPADQNHYRAAGFESSTTPGELHAGQIIVATGRIKVDNAGGGSGTVTSVSVVSANGFAGTVATATTTPAITLSTTVTGLLKGNGTAISAASATTDYAAVAFKTISVSGQSDVVADSPIDTLTLVAGTGMTITTNATTDTITFTVTGGSATDITVGTTTVSGGTSTRILYDNAGVLGEYTLTGSGTVVVMQNTPTLTTPVLGVATATSINKVAITAPATSATLTIADGKTATHNATTTFAGTDGKTLTISNSGTLAGGDAFVLAIAAGKTLTQSNTLTYTGTDGSSVNFGAGGTVLYSASTIPLTVGSTTIASGTTTRILYDNAGVLGEYTITGTGTVVAMQTSPSFTTPSLGVATATTINGNTFTTGTYTLTGQAGKTLTFNGSITLTGTDAQTYTFPTTSKTLAANDGSNWTFASQAIGDLVYASSTTAFTRLAAVATGQVLVSAGTGTAPAYSANPSVTTVELGSGGATDTTLSRSAAGVLAVEGVVIPSISSTNTLTNKRITRRLSTSNAPGATPTTNTDNVDIQAFTGLNTAITSMTTNLSGTPAGGDYLMFQFTDDGTARGITWGATFTSTTVTLPTTTVISTLLRVGFQWNATTSKWNCIATA